MPHTVIQREFKAFTSADVKHIVNGSEVVGGAIAGTAEVTFDFGLLMSANVPTPLRRKKFRIVQVELIRASGVSVTNYQPQIHDVSAAATTAWATKYLGAVTAPGTRFGVTDIQELVYTDTAGKLFFKPNGDAADTFHYIVWFEVLG